MNPTRAGSIRGFQRVYGVAGYRVRPRLGRTLAVSSPVHNDEAMMAPELLHLAGPSGRPIGEAAVDQQQWGAGTDVSKENRLNFL